jgi:hypothetical protein
MAAADLSGISFFVPIAAFLIVFIVVFLVLKKTKLLGEHDWVLLFISFLMAIIFVSVAGARQYIQTIVPWFAVLIISLVFLLLIVGFVGKPTEFLTKGIGIAFVIFLALVFLITGFFIYSSALAHYLPGPGFGTGDNLEATMFLDWVYTPRVGGAILLIIISAGVSWILVKAK